MVPVIFGWHDAKHERNLRERGFGFDFAALVFDGRVLVQTDDRRDYGEVRVKAIGEVEGVVLVVVFTDRGDARWSHLGPSGQQEGACAMARMTLEEIKALRPRIDRARIEATTEAEIARQMVEDGEDPSAELGVFVEDMPPARIREQLGMSQAAFAAALTIPVATLRNWEQGRVRPDPAARALLRIVARTPETALAALTGSAQGSIGR